MFGSMASRQARTVEGNVRTAVRPSGIRNTWNQEVAFGNAHARLERPYVLDYRRMETPLTQVGQHESVRTSGAARQEYP
jgi:hypothetical protein